MFEWHVTPNLTKELSITDISKKPHQPFNLSFPKLEVGKDAGKRQKTVSIVASSY